MSNGMTRRDAAIGMLAGGSLLTGASGALAQTPEHTRAIETTIGRVRGTRSNGVSSFKNIPYGADTTSRRFQPALPAPAWRGVRDCFAFGPQCPQLSSASSSAAMANAPPALRAVSQLFGVGGGAASSEDCLILNVFTPDASRAHKRPVMFWLHGGGFTMGSGGIPAYDGSALCRRGDVVVVTINHRLNALGYLYLGALHDDFADSGMVGQLDQVLALQWVRDNIEAFGGDPNNVTIFGESGGGAKVSTLMAMPSASRLFHKAIIQSGPGLRMFERDTAAAMAERTLAALNIAPTNVHELQTLDAMQVIQTATSAGGGGPMGAVRAFSPVVDGRSLPRHPSDPDAPAISRDIPVIVGSNKDEATLFMVMTPGFGTWTEEQARAQFSAMLGERANAGWDAIRAVRPDNSPTHMVTSLATAQGTWIQSVQLAERKAALGGAPVYMYRFDWETPILDGIFKSPHGLEVALVFDNVEAATESGPGFLGDGVQARQIAALMSQSWINFARTADPSVANVAWPAYEASARQTMIFDTEIRVVADPDRQAREFLSP
jgi:para-nitrobenzyl esterase